MESYRREFVEGLADEIKQLRAKRNQMKEALETICEMTKPLDDLSDEAIGSLMANINSVARRGLKE